MPFDPEQTEAINAIHTNVIVRASAGAGKTGVLVARLVKRCVTDGIPVSRILAVTFTEAAASVKVTARILDTGIPSVTQRLTRRATSTPVLPAPALALTMTFV